MTEFIQKRLDDYAVRQWVTEERQPSDLLNLADHLVGLQAQEWDTSALSAFSRIKTSTDELHKELF